jgi:hypothetical protein
MNHPDAANHCTNCGAALPAVGDNSQTHVTPVEPQVSAPVNQPVINIESHLVKAVISTACCCIPLGIAAIVFAAQVQPYLRMKNYEAASEASKKANLWGNLAIGVGIVMQIFWLIFYQLFFQVISGFING